MTTDSPGIGEASDNLFAVEKVFNQTSKQHLQVHSVFFKKMNTSDCVAGIKRLNQTQGFNPEEHRFKQLCSSAARLAKTRPDVGIRIYLAADLDFLVPKFLKFGCEIFLMKSSSIAHNPGAMWRFLALEEEGRLVTFADADRAMQAEADIAMTEEMARLGLKFWRVPVFQELNSVGQYNYRPIRASGFGSNLTLPAGDLMKALIWATHNGAISTKCRPPGEPEYTISGTQWPDYGFDEWFLQAAVYPRVAQEGILTLVPATVRSKILPLDIEYCTWANPDSELCYFGEEHPKLPLISSGKSRKPTSKTLRFLLGEGKRRELAMEPASKKNAALPKATLVVARYQEDLAWLAKVDRGIRVVVYNKGPAINDEAALARIDHLTKLPNRGREADTYLAHLQKGRTDDDGEFTIFCQGEPFTHSPDFLELLEHRDHWEAVQALTATYDNEKQIPPEQMREREQGQWLGRLRVRTEPFSPWTLQTLGWYDAPAREWMDGFHRRHGTPKDWSVTGYFMDLVGLPEVAREAWTHYSGQFAYGAIFAVAEERLNRIPAKSLAVMRKLACDDPLHGYLFERLWLHLFGLPFSLPEQAKVDAFSKLAEA